MRLHPYAPIRQLNQIANRHEIIFWDIVDVSRWHIHKQRTNTYVLKDCNGLRRSRATRDVSYLQKRLEKVQHLLKFHYMPRTLSDFVRGTFYCSAYKWEMIPGFEHYSSIGTCYAHTSNH